MKEIGKTVILIVQYTFLQMMEIPTEKTDGQEDSLSLTETFFGLKYNLCKEFPSLTPWDLEERSYYKVMKLYKQLRTMQIKGTKRAGTKAAENTPAGWR